MSAEKHLMQETAIAVHNSRTPRFTVAASSRFSMATLGKPSVQLQAKKNKARASRINLDDPLEPS